MTINEQQVELNRLAIEKDRRSIKPKFVIEEFTSLDGINKVVFGLRNYAAYGIEMTIIRGIYEIKTSFENQEVYKVGHRDIIEFWESGNPSEDIYDGLLITLFFSDEADRTYYQSLYFQQQEMYITNPFLYDKNTHRGDYDVRMRQKNYWDV